MEILSQEETEETEREKSFGRNAEFSVTADEMGLTGIR
jgi:hypothetical protein